MTKMSQQSEHAQKKEQEPLLDERVNHLIGTLTSRFLGVHVSELNKDLSTKLSKTPFIEFTIDSQIPFKEAKKLFKKQYLNRMLRLNLGNIAEVAKKVKVNRRSLHRLILDLGIDVKQIKEELPRPYDVKVTSVSTAIEHILDQYKGVLHPEKLESLYKNISEMSQSILPALSDAPLSLRTAVQEFEKRYFQKALDEQNFNLAAVARKVKLRYETLHRKLKSLGLI